MHRRFHPAVPATCPALLALAVLTLLAGACGGSAQEPPPTAEAPGQDAGTYVPQPVFCADGSGAPCGVMPSMVGPDPGLGEGPRFGYEGLSSHVDSFDRDSQTPFDNMAWQMFVALNQEEGGESVWQGYTRVEEVFGGAPTPACPNPNGRAVFALTAKADGQPSHRLEEFLQAATNAPLIDSNGNWTLFERRLNDVELDYLNEKGLTTLEGQKKFVEAGHTVDFTESEDEANGALGSIELKLAWRILDLDQGDDPSRYLTLDALLAVDASEVRGSDEPICDPVQLGLVGFHIVQKNPTRGALKPEWIWATFEHQDNAPLSPNACDPVTSECFVKPDPDECTAPADASGTYSYFDPACTDQGGDCPVNTAPAVLDGEDTYLWSPERPYAAPYRYDGAYGTQVARCFQIYYLTRQLDTQWRQELAGMDGVFPVLANYQLVGTQWGGDVEPRRGIYTNGAVPAFLSNTTMETYIQTEEFGTCVGCHSNATLAYKTEDEKGKKTTYPADFSFLLGLAE